MEITNVRMKKVNNNDRVLAVISVQFDNCLIVHDIKIIQLEDKRIISFPNKKYKRYEMTNGSYEETFEYTDIVHPSNKELEIMLKKHYLKFMMKEELNNE